MTDAPSSEQLRLQCERAGLTRALELFPDIAKAAAERGLRPVGDLPKGHSPITHPAPIFNPAQYERDR